MHHQTRIKHIAIMKAKRSQTEHAHQIYHARVCERQLGHKRTSKLHANFDSKKAEYVGRAS